MKMPRVMNEKEVSPSGKAIIYRMERVVNGHRISLAFAVTFEEYEQGRDAVAAKIWKMRASLQARALLVDRWLMPMHERRALPRAMAAEV